MFSVICIASHGGNVCCRLEPSHKQIAVSAIATEPVAIQLCYLQTLTEIGVEQNTTVGFPVPVQMFEALVGLKDRGRVEIPVACRREPLKVS